MAQAIQQAPAHLTATRIDLYDVDVAFTRLEDFPSFNLDILDGHPEGHRGAVCPGSSRRLSLGVWDCPPGHLHLRGGGVPRSNAVSWARPG